MPFTKEQLCAIEAQGKTIVSASAGSGKTTVMIEKIIRLITSGVDVEEILAVTFTKKAAAQMKEKLSRALIEEINDPTVDGEKKARLKRQLASVPNADISTIHSFCSKLIRSYFFIADVSSTFRVIGGDDAEGRAMKNQALDELLEEGYESQDERFLHLLSSYWRKKKDASLRNIFIKCYADLRNKADYREYLLRTQNGYDEKTFDDVCADLLKRFQERCHYYYELVEDENAYFMDAHPPAKSQLLLCERLMAWLTELSSATDYFAAKSIEKPTLTQNRGTGKDGEEKRKHIARLGFIKERIVEGVGKEFDERRSREEELESFLRSGKTAAAVATYLLRFDEKYEALKREKGTLDYNDLEHKALALLKIPEVVEDMQKKYRYVFVDEYQDVNPVQEELISRLAKENLFLVGDVKQSIYGFRGSKSAFFVEKQREFAEGDGKSLYMKYNFRSADKVLDAVNKQFALAMTPKTCDVDYARNGVMEKGGRYEANSGKVQIHFTPKEKSWGNSGAEIYSVLEDSKYHFEVYPHSAYTMASVIREEMEGYLDDVKGKRKVRYSDIAVLTRKTAGEIEKQIAALTEFGYPVSSASTVNVCNFTEVKTLVDILSLLDDAEQDIPLCSALLSSMGGLTADDLAEIRLAYKESKNFRAACKRYAQEKENDLSKKLRNFYGYFYRLRDESHVLTVGEILTKILVDTEMEKRLLARKSGTACLKRVRRFCEEATTFDGSSVHDFLEHLRNLEYKIDYSENGGEDAIKVMTMHSSKGLEFPIVLLANLSQYFKGTDALEVYVEEKYGLAPRAFYPEKMIRRSTVLRRLYEVNSTQSSLVDELNLYYVAMTRAEQKLHLFFTERPVMADVKYARSFAEFTNFDVWEEYIVEKNLGEWRNEKNAETFGEGDEELTKKIRAAIAWKYSHTGYENLPVKSSPTQLMEGGRYAPTQRFIDYGKEREPDEDEMKAAQRDLAVREGTAYHAFLERFDFSSLIDAEGAPVVNSILEGLVEESLASLSEKDLEVSLLSKEKLVEILSNSVFYRLQDRRLYKEQQFLVSLPVKDTYAKRADIDPSLKDREDGEEMLFQGAIDLLAVGEDDVEIVDYKYSTRGTEELRVHYQPQLDLYKRAVSKIMSVPLERIRCSIVNIRLGFEVEMP